MNKKVALLLDQEENQYQQLLLNEAKVRAPRRSLQLQRPHYANGSAVAQMEQLLGCAKSADRPDAVILVPAGRESQLPACRRVVKAGLSLVLLNRVPPYLEELRNESQDALVAAVAPDQVEIGRIQAEQLAQVAPDAGFVLLVTGTPSNDSAISRRKGFLEASRAADVHVLEGEWSEESGYEALRDFFRLGADRNKQIGAVVCQNDQMARGSRRALAERASATGDQALTDVPLLGCDGLPQEGQRMVSEGTLAGTVIMPPTTGRALDLLAAFWEHGAKADVVLLPPDSHPPLSQIRTA